MVWLKINAPGKSEFHYIGKFENLLISELESELQQFLACLTSSVTTPILFIAYEMGPEAAGIAYDRIELSQWFRNPGRDDGEC